MFEHQSKRKILSFLIIDNTKMKENYIGQNTNKMYIQNIKRYISDIPLLLSKDND